VLPLKLKQYAIIVKLQNFKQKNDYLSRKLYNRKAMELHIVDNSIEANMVFLKDMYILGLFIVIFGLAFLLRNLGVIDFPGSFWGLFYPVMIIGIGGVVICVTHKGRQLLKKIKNLLGWADRVK